MLGNLARPFLLLVMVSGLFSCGDSRPTTSLPDEPARGPGSIAVVFNSQGASGPPGELLPVGLVVQDSSRHFSLPGEPMAYEILSGDAEIVSSERETDEDGLASVDVRLGRRLGSVRVRATALTTGDSGVLLLYVVDPDRFGPRYVDCPDVSVELWDWPDTTNEAIWHLDVTSDGTRAAYVRVPRATGADWRLQIRDLATAEQSDVMAAPELGHISFSPAGNQLAIEVTTDSTSAIVIVDIDGNARTLVSGRLNRLGHRRVGHPSWSPDGHSIAFTAEENYTAIVSDIWLVDVDSGSETNLTSTIRRDPNLDRRHAQADYRGPQWLPDGRLSFAVRGALWVLDPATLSVEEILVDHEGGVRSARWSTNGLIAYGSVRSNLFHVFLHDPRQDLWCRAPSGRDVDTGAGVWLDENTLLVPLWHEGGRVATLSF